MTSFTTPGAPRRGPAIALTPDNGKNSAASSQDGAAAEEMQIQRRPLPNFHGVTLYNFYQTLRGTVIGVNPLSTPTTSGKRPRQGRYRSPPRARADGRGAQRVGGYPQS
jgi:hypothetical protein